MNETIVKTEKLTELKNLVSEIEGIKKSLFLLGTNDYIHFFEINNKIDEKEKQLFKLIKTL